MGMARSTRERGREQAGMTREGRRTMEKVLENTVRDIIEQKHVSAVVNLKFNAVSNTLLGKKIMRGAHSGLR